MGSIYPDDIDRIVAEASHAGSARGANGVGTAASFDCGSFVRVGLRIDPASKRIEEACFRSNGCGIMVAAAELVCEAVEGRSLTDLRGRAGDEVRGRLTAGGRDVPARRLPCIDACIEALDAAFADFRAFVIEEFVGERPLVCTCFAVGEDEIVRAVETRRLTSVEQVGEALGAGRGCGSCRMLIEEIIEAHV
ncbi:MAG: (2Fe-2S)-binding protein [Pyrinomonadaceae bacterium]